MKTLPRNLDIIIRTDQFYTFMKENEITKSQVCYIHFIFGKVKFGKIIKVKVQIFITSPALMMK